MNSLKLKMANLEADSVKNIMDDKSQDVLSFFQNIIGVFTNWLDDMFPPGTRLETLKNWIIVAAPYVILGLLLLLCLPCIMGIFNCFFRMFMGIFYCFFKMFKGIFKFFLYILKGIFGYLRKILCCCCLGGKKMMKAPGRNVNILRMRFEANPAAYFRGLHANQPISSNFLV
ncbi:hypothetical protein LIER_40581 [Lithospermum erythrorhizon]|uniref:Uncharacterized protein n=1 Tax=Lithospermum erythrorhizon TaxID=34254 RepID=A0AAV3QZW3_LITER